MQKVKLNKVCKIGNGFAFKSEDYLEVGVPLLRISNINEGLVNFKYDSICVSENNLNTKKDFIVEKGDVVIALSGATTGKYGIYVNEEPALLNQRIGIIKSNSSEKLDSKYFYFYLNILRDEILRKAGGAAQPNISTKDIGNLEIPLPSLPTQQKIANILDKADELRQYNKQLIEKYEALTQSLFLDMFGDPVKNEKGWEKMELGKISDMASGSTPSRTDDNNFIGNVPWVKTTEVNGKLINNTLEKISEEALKNSSCRLFPKGSIVIAMYGQGKTRGQIGILGIEAATNQACCVLRPSNKMNFQFLYYTLTMLYDDLRSLGRGGNQPNLNLGLLKSYELINPSIILQNQFAERVAVIEAQKQQAQQALAKSEELFQGLLQQAFNGELN